MTDDIRYQRTCFYASAEYSASFWGKFIYLYQGKGSLRLTTDSLRLEGCPQAIEIPFHAIKRIGLGRFSTWSKPFGLRRLTVGYEQDGEPREIHLIPYESVLDPTWATSKLVESWHETLGSVEGLANRVEPPQFEPAASPSVGSMLAFAAFLLVFAIAIPMAMMWLLSYLLMKPPA